MNSSAKTIPFFFGAILVLVLPFSSASSAASSDKEKTPLDVIRTSVDVMTRIRSEYVFPVNDERLLAACFDSTSPDYGYSIAQNDTEAYGFGDRAAFVKEFASQMLATIHSNSGTNSDTGKFENLAQKCIVQVMGSLDSLSKYIEKKDFDALASSANKGVGGIGIELESADNGVRVVNAIEGTPSELAGLMSGDVITHIDGESLQGLPLEEGVRRLRGKPDSTVMLKIVHKGSTDPLDVALMRKVIVTNSVKFWSVENEFAYLHISRLSVGTAKSLTQALEEMYRANHSLKGIVLDLRGNQGGLLSAGVAVSSVFLPKDTLIVYTQGRSTEANMRLAAKPEDYLDPFYRNQDYIKSLPDAVKKLPLVVLVDKKTASGAEIIAAALQAHQRAKVVGKPTFGMTSIQTILPMADGSALKLTTARWFTPNGHNVEKTGITPDVLVDAELVAGKERGTANDPHFLEALKVLKNVASPEIEKSALE